jgi:hypothetical protein
VPRISDDDAIVIQTEPKANPHPQNLRSEPNNTWNVECQRLAAIAAVARALRTPRLPYEEGECASRALGLGLVGALAVNKTAPLVVKYFGSDLLGNFGNGLQIGR